MWRVWSVIPLILVGFIGIQESFAEEFDVNGYTVTAHNPHITEINLDWGNGILPSGTILFDKIIQDKVILKIPKEMPRTTNLDFGFGLYAIQFPTHAELIIKQTETDCFYFLEIPVRNSNKIELTSVSVIAGRIVTQVVNDCGEPENIKLSLKIQLENYLHIKEIECRNENHVLSQRPNGKLSCVTPYTMAKLELDSVNKSLWSKIIRFEQPFAIFTHLSETQNVQSVKYYEGMNSIMIHIINDKSKKLSVNANRAILETPTKNCEIPEWSNYIVLINGEEVGYENRLTTDHYRYLEIQVDLPTPSEEYTMRGANDIHAYYDIPFEKDSMIIEILGTCLI